MAARVVGRRVRRNDKCPLCPSGRKFKDCCIAFASENEIGTPRYLATFLRYRDLWPTRHPSASSVLRKLRDIQISEIVGALARIGIVLHAEYMAPNRSIEHGILRDLIDPVSMHKIDAWIRSGLRNKVLTRKLILSLCRFVLANKASLPGGKPLRANTKLLGEAILQFTDVFEADYIHRHNTAPTERARFETTLASIYRDLFYDRRLEFGLSLARHWAMTYKGRTAIQSRYPGEYFDFAGQFASSFGLEYERMLALGFGIWVHYDRPPHEFLKAPVNFQLDEGFFRALRNRTTRESASEILRYLGTDLDACCRLMANTFVPDNFLQLSELYNHPVVKLPTGFYVPLDIQFLELALSEGPYWSLFNFLQENGMSEAASCLRGYMGRAFEWYCAEQLHFIVSPADNIRVYLDWREEFQSKDGTSIPDAVVIEGDRAYVLEFTTTSVRPSESMSADPKCLRAALRRIWLDDDENRDSRGKLSQLFRSCVALSTSALGLDTEIISRVQHTVPILVMLRPLPQIEQLLEWYRTIVTDAAPECRELASGLELWDIDVFETMVEHLRLGTGWNAVFRDLSESQLSEEPLGLFLQQDSRYGLLGNSTVHAWREEALDQLSELLFSKRIGSIRGE